MYQVEEIDIDLLEDNPYDQRKKVGDIEGLAESIKERGLQNPITIVKVEDHFVIAHGHRRTHAFRYLKRKKIPAIVRKESTPEDLMIDLAVENLQRKDLLPIEKGATIEQLFYTIPNVQKNRDRIQSLLYQVKFYGKHDIGVGFAEEDIFKAKKFLGLVGMSTTAANIYVRILSLPEEIQRNVVSVDNASLIPDGNIVTKSAYELTRIKDSKLQKELYQKTIDNKMTHIQLKDVVDQLIEENDMVARDSNRGSVKRKTEDDIGAAKLTEDLFKLSSKVDSFRSRLPLVCGRLEKAQWTASLNSMKKTCLDMVKNINNLIQEDMKIEGLLEYANTDLEISITNEMRYRFPNRIADILKVKEGDILFLKIEGIKRFPPKLEAVKTVEEIKTTLIEEHKEENNDTRINTS